MSAIRQWTAAALVCGAMATGMAHAGSKPSKAGDLPAAPTPPTVTLKDISLDKPLVLDEPTSYHLRNVNVTGLADGAAITLAGTIRSVLIERSTFGRVWSGPDGRAAGIECAGAIVGKLVARDTTFFDAEHQLATLREGSFGRVTFERCRFSTSEAFLKEIYTANPWRTWPPVTEFYNIDRLELLDNEYSNTTVIIHPSVKQVILRGSMPGLQIENPLSTQVIRLEAGQHAGTVPRPAGPGVAGLLAGNGATKG